MTSKYDNSILTILSSIDWCKSKTSIWRKLGINFNKKDIFDRIDYLESMEFLESRMFKNKKQYRRKDTGESHSKFLDIMKNFEVNQKAELKKIEKLKTITRATGKLGIKGKELLDHVQDEVDRAYIVMIRMNYQKQLDIIPFDIADKRIETLQDHIDKIMLVLTNEYDHNLIKEYFQNHVKRLEFKI